MFLTISYVGMDTFEKDLEDLKTADEQHLNASQVAEELREELERLGSDGEESHVYRTAQQEFHFTMTAQGDISLSIHYAGYTECS